MEQTHHLKKTFLITMIVALCISALIGVIIFLIGNFGRIEMRILTTTISIGIYSLIGLGFSVLYEKRKLFLFSSTGLILAILSFIVTVLSIWDIIGGDLTWKSQLIFFILAVSFLHISLILLAKDEKTYVNVVVSLTIFFISLVAFLLIILILAEIREEFFFRFLGATAILDGLGTIVTPIVKKVSNLHIN